MMFVLDRSLFFIHFWFFKLVEPILIRINDIFLKYEHGWSSEKKLNHALHWNCQHYLKHQLIVDYLKAYQSDGHNVTDRNDNLLNLLNKHLLAS